MPDDDLPSHSGAPFSSESARPEPGKIPPTTACSSSLPPDQKPEEAPAGITNSAPPNDSQRPHAIAWQPLTPRGVATFSHASTGNLLFVEMIVGLLVAITLTWFLIVAWFPTMRAAIRALPDKGVIRYQELILTHVSTAPLAEDRFLAIVVDVNQQSRATLPSDVRVEFHRRDFAVCSLFGCWIFAYPQGWEIQFNRVELEPWWGAWKPVLLVLVVCGTVLSLLLSWTVIAALLCPLVFLFAYFKDRSLTWSGSWRMASAALMPGAVLMMLAIFAYGTGALDLLRFLVISVAHLLVPLAYIVTATPYLPPLRAREAKSPNPFSPDPGAS